MALFFLASGTTAFGGPAAHIAIMEDELVRRRKWLTRDKFLDLLGASNLIPGPSSSELAIHIGYLRAGWMGLSWAGFASSSLRRFWWHASPGRTCASDIYGGCRLLYGVKPVVVAVILQALWGSGARRSRIVCSPSPADLCCA